MGFAQEQSSARPEYRLEQSGSDHVLFLSGPWTLQKIQGLLQKISPRSGVLRLRIDGSQLTAFDTAGAMLVLQMVQSFGLDRKQVDLIGFAEDFRSIAKLVYERYGVLKREPQEAPFNVIQDFGKTALRIWNLFSQFVNSFGEFVCESAQLLTKPGLFRPREFFVQLEQCCVYALPIVALVTFLIGVVVAYLSATQLERYGASIFLVDGVGITMCRELSPVLVAIIMAGRSGSAFTAQIGAMKINEEIDAIKTLGLSPLHVLVLPRVLALAVAMPLLTLVGDLVGISGGMIIGKEYLGITLATFVDRLQTVVPVRHLILGMIKAPIFALVIGLIGCRMGLEVESNASSVGSHTTSTVVQCIVAVILLDAAFALFFSQMKF